MEHWNSYKTIRLYNGDFRNPDSGEKDTLKELVGCAKVIEVGPGEKINDKLEEMYVKKGDRVIINTYSGSDVKYEGEEYKIVRQSDILAIID